MATSVAEAEAMCGLTMDEVMGITSSNETPLEKEASEIWKHLDHLASTDPKEYRRFVDQQIKEGQDYMGKNGSNGPPPPQARVPTSVFWVETEVLESSGKPTGIPRYFNVCESEAIEYTDDKNLNIYMSELDNRQVDCVIHPKFMKRCTDDNVFLHDTVQLIFRTYMAEHVEKEQVRMQYKHHDESKKLVMKVPKAPREKKAQGDSTLDVLSKVRHHEKAQQMVADDREDAAKRLFSLYGTKDSGAKAKQPDVQKLAAAGPEVTPPERHAGIEVLRQKLQYSASGDDSTLVVRIEVPEGKQPADFDVELDETSSCPLLVIATASHETLTLPIKSPKAPTSYSAKFIRSKNVLKIMVT